MTEEKEPCDQHPPVHLLPEVLQSWWAVWEIFLCQTAEALTILQKVTHELLPVVHVKVAVALQGAAELATRCHDALHTLHELVTHLGQLGHGLHVGLREHQGGIAAAGIDSGKQCWVFPDRLLPDSWGRGCAGQDAGPARRF